MRERTESIMEKRIPKEIITEINPLYFEIRDAKRGKF